VKLLSQTRASALFGAGGHSPKITRMQNPAVTRRALLTWAGAAAGASVLSGCAGVLMPSSITLSEADLARWMERSLPIDRRMLDVLDVSITGPQVRLLPAQNRLAVSLNVKARDRLFSNSWNGRLALDSALRWNAADQSLRLRQVAVSDFSIDAGSAAMRSQFERVGSVLAERVLEDWAIYTLPADKHEVLQRAGRMPSAVTVTRRGVEITFEPAAR
jgi:hypothetical protein